MTQVFKPPVNFDAGGVASCRSEIEGLINAHGDVVIDMGRVQSIDGSGFGVIAYLYKRLVRAERTVALVNVAGEPRELLQKTGFLAVLNVDAGFAVAAVLASAEQERDEMVLINSRQTAA